MQDYKCLCTVVTICATLFFPKFDLFILIPITSKSRSSSRDLLHPCQVHPRSKFGDRRSASCRDNADMSILMMTLKPSKVGQEDLVFGVRLRCISGSVHTTLLVSVCIGYDLCHPGCPKCFLSIVTPLTPKSRSNPRQLLHPARCIHNVNLMTAGQLLADIMQI